jgi:hypothetical protein
MRVVERVWETVEAVVVLKVAVVCMEVEVEVYLALGSVAVVAVAMAKEAVVVMSTTGVGYGAAEGCLESETLANRQTAMRGGPAESPMGSKPIYMCHQVAAEQWLHVGRVGRH